jgi:hypothetical protein
MIGAADALRGQSVISPVGKSAPSRKVSGLVTSDV